MAHTLSLVYGGTTVALAAGDYRIREYVPRPADPGAETVEETAVIQITGSSLAAMQADIRAIELAFERARLRQDGKSFVQVFIQFQGDSESALWQSEVMGGRVIPPDTALGADWANRVIEVGVIWSRAPFWEAASWTALSLANDNGSGTSGVVVYNNADGTGSSPTKKVHHVNIAAANVAGNLPAPVKLRLTGQFRKIMIFQQADLAGLGRITAPISEFEDWAGFYSGGSSASATCSGGLYLVFNHPGGSWETLYDDIDLSLYKGGYHRILARVPSTALATVKMYLQIGHQEGTPLFLETTPTVFDDAGVIDLGNVRLPPGRDRLPGSGTIDNFRFWLNVYADSAITIQFDVLYMIPVDSFMMITSLGQGVGATERLVWSEGFDDNLYKEIAATGLGVRNNFETEGGGIWLTPGVDQCLHFVQPQATIATSVTVEAWYKPRRNSL
jgi:hypothetical protein